MFNSQNSRICRKCLWLRNNTPTPITAEKLRLVFERLNEGETLSSVFGKKSDQSFVVRRLSLVHFMDRHPRIKRKILTLANKNAWLFWIGFMQVIDFVRHRHSFAMTEPAHTRQSYTPQLHSGKVSAGT